MTTQKPHHLSQAQAYYLHALGVDLYGLKAANEQELQPQKEPSQQEQQAPIEQAKQQAPSLEAVKLKLQAKSKPQLKPQLKPQSQISNQAQIPKQPQPQMPVVLMSEKAFKQAKLVADLCLLHGVGADEVKNLGDDYFQIGAMQWRFVERVDRTTDVRFKFADNKLISEPLNKLTDVKTKRALWSALVKTLP